MTEQTIKPHTCDDWGALTCPACQEEEQQAQRASQAVATVRQAPLRSGDEGKTTCFMCGTTFSYSGGTIARVHTDDLCNQPCRPGPGHRWDCHALGGDLCDRCAEDVRTNPDDVPGMLRARSRWLRDQAMLVEAYERIPWTSEG